MTTRALPAEADYCPPNCANVENPSLAEFAGTIVRVPANLGNIPFRSIDTTAPDPLGLPQGDYFHPKYDISRSDPAHNWDGIGVHRPIAAAALDGNAVNIFSNKTVGDFTVRAVTTGRVAVSFYQEQLWQWQVYSNDIFGNPILRLDLDMVYYLDGLLPGQKVQVVDPDSGYQMLYPETGARAEFYSNGSTMAFDVPKANGDVRFQLVFPVQNVGGYPPQDVRIHRGPNDRPGTIVINSLPRGVTKPAVPGEY